MRDVADPAYCVAQANLLFGSLSLFMDITVAAQGISLLLFFIRTSITALLYLPYAILQCLTSQKAPATQEQDGDGSCVFYEGTVYHVRRKPIHNAFRYAEQARALFWCHHVHWARPSSYLWNCCPAGTL